MRITIEMERLRRRKERKQGLANWGWRLKGCLCPCLTRQPIDNDTLCCREEGEEEREREGKRREREQNGQWEWGILIGKTDNLPLAAAAGRHSECLCAVSGRQWTDTDFEITPSWGAIFNDGGRRDMVTHSVNALKRIGTGNERLMNRVQDQEKKTEFRQE